MSLIFNVSVTTTYSARVRVRVVTMYDIYIYIRVRVVTVYDIYIYTFPEHKSAEWKQGRYNDFLKS